MALAALVCAGCASSAAIRSPAAQTAKAAVDPHTQLPALERDILALIQTDRHRLDAKARTLHLDPVLVDVARKRAADMAKKGYFADSAPDGTTSASLVMDEDAQFQGLLGVNIAAQHYTKRGGIDPAVFARRFVATWMKSPSHKQNLAFPDYDRTGVGAAINGDTVIVVQLFATDLGLPKAKHAKARGKPARVTSPEAGKTAMESPPPQIRHSAPLTAY